MGTRQRVSRGAGMQRVQINFRVSPAAKDAVNQVADATGLTQGQIMEAILERLAVSNDGRVLLDGVAMNLPVQEGLALTG